jgi:hypothetical protein
MAQGGRNMMISRNPREERDKEVEESVSKIDAPHRLEEPRPRG